jgi:translation elongation factor P/translation initiation factor 5A
MDLESYETIELSIPEEIKEEIKDGDQVEYWNAEGTKMIKKKI